MDSYTGLTTAEAKRLLAVVGPNVIREQKKRLAAIIKSMFSPIILMLLSAAGLSFALGKIFDAYFILVLLAVNYAVDALQRRKADKALEQIQAQFVISLDVLRDNAWHKIRSTEIVPGDIVRLFGGDIAPADLKLLEATEASVNEAAISGESMSKEKKPGDPLLVNTIMLSGVVIGQVTATGNRTTFGSVIKDASVAQKRSLLEQDILVISKFLSSLSLFAVVILSIVFLILKTPFLEIIRLDLGLVIAGIPISLPTVMAIIIALGVLELARKKVVVRRLASLENLANVDLFLSDKTGTLTENKITVERAVPYGNYSEADVIRLAAASAGNEHHVIDKAIAEKAKAMFIQLPEVAKIIPADAARKHNTAFIKDRRGEAVVIVGAPQAIADRIMFPDGLKDKFWSEVNTAAKQGYGALVVGAGYGKTEEKDLELAGTILFSDTLRPDAQTTINLLRQDGITVKMLTGDNRAIGERVGTALGFSGPVITPSDMPGDWNNLSPQWLDDKQIFAEILPEDKLQITNLAKQNHVVAVTGDGINDLPALKAADVGIAVANAVDAVKSSADIFLLSTGISVILRAFEESRKIFSRLYTYSVYRLSESFRLIITIVVLGIFYHQYPATPVLLILIALFNDIPIISLAFDRVEKADKPQTIHVHERFLLSSLFGFMGILNSLLLFLIFTYIVPVPWTTLITMFFLKLLVSGHMLIYVAHTRKRWYRFLPSAPVIWATTLTQIGATAIAFFGIFTAPISWPLIIFVWVWSFFWMQLTEVSKVIYQKFLVHPKRQLAAQAG